MGQMDNLVEKVLILSLYLQYFNTESYQYLKI